MKEYLKKMDIGPNSTEFNADDNTFLIFLLRHITMHF